MLRTITGPLAVVCALALSACGSDDGGATSTSTSTTAAASAAFPVTVEQALGSVTIDEEPERVVALDYPSADAAIALGVVPVGMYEVTYVEGGVQSWTKAALDGEQPELIDTEGGFPFEQIAALQPDVILATNTYPLIEGAWRQLNAIAPVVGHVEGPGVDTWQQGVEQVGTALGREDEAERLIADVEDQVAEAASSHPEFEGKTVSFFNYQPTLWVINDEDDASIQFLRELGFAGLTAKVAAMRGAGGRAEVSPERYRDIDADVILGTSPDPAALRRLEQETLFQRIPAVARGAYVSFGIGPATAMAFPSALSIPYALDELVEPLTGAVAAGDGG